MLRKPNKLEQAPEGLGNQTKKHRMLRKAVKTAQTIRECFRNPNKRTYKALEG